MVQVTAGEIWYLRQLLYHFSAVSFQGIKTINNVMYNAFQEEEVLASGTKKNASHVFVNQSRTVR